MSGLTADGEDTALARALHAEGALALETLQGCLLEVRARRQADPRASLMALLWERRLLPDEALRRFMSASGADATDVQPPARAPHPARRATGLRSALANSQLAASGERPEAGPAAQQLGPYRVVRELARGGMGAVYEAVHTATGAPVALKTILVSPVSGVEDPEALARFRKEAQLSARLDHPHVVRIHTAQLDHPPCYLVQDLLPGGSLHERLRTGPLPVAEALAIAAALASAVQHAHDQGVLHRDLKPQNVLFDDQGQPRLTDFGLARTVTRESVVSLTRSGTVLGSPCYMAPEQALGERVDVRTDVYGLGAVLYCMLTGAPPHDGLTSMEVITKVIERPVTPPRRVRPEVPGFVDAVCLKALAKRPGERYPTAAALGEALEVAAATLAGQAEGAPSPTRGRRRVLSALLAAGLLTALGLGGAWLLRRATPGAPAAAPSAPPRETDSPRAGPAATQPAPAPAPAPDPALASAPSLRWALAPGERLRVAVRSNLRPGERSDEAPGTPPSWESSTRIEMTWTVLSALPGDIELECVLDAIESERRVGDEEVVYRSGPGSDPAHPFAAVVGRRVRFHLDPGTGRVDEVRGMDDVQRAVFAALRSQPRVPQLYMVGNNASLGYYLRTLLQVTPDRVAAVGDTWRTVIAGGGRGGGGAVWLPEAALDVRYAGSTPEGEQLTWSGVPSSELNPTRYEGQATFARGRMRASEARIKGGVMTIELGLELLAP